MLSLILEGTEHKIPDLFTLLCTTVFIIYMPNQFSGKITEEEFENFNGLGVEDYLNIVMREHPRHRQRNSEQVWLPMHEAYDPILFKLRDRYIYIYI